MDLYEQIIEESKKITEKIMSLHKEDLYAYSIIFSVPTNHPRSRELSEYRFMVTSIDTYEFDENSIFLVDEDLKNIVFLKEFLDGKEIYFLKSSEFETKTNTFADAFISKNLSDKTKKTVVSIGGGLIQNVVGYIAEHTKSDLIYIPTTPLSMSDSSTGGKIRLNSIKDGKFLKHSYKSFFEPNAIVVDPRFLDTFPDNVLHVNIAEIIKHGFYQSEDLFDYLLSEKFNINDKTELLRAILWTVELKRIAWNIDSHEMQSAFNKIIRAGHDISDRLEEESELSISHGEALLRGLYIQATKENHPHLKKMRSLYDKLGLSKYYL
ncbi:hypothetical protein COB64_02480 [Candidatus Wolfebacteria bacterium]|nr:MAG: hypothetical protein COB64_02480 [Candidatus Wolfebacteria bacterium]